MATTIPTKNRSLHWTLLLLAMLLAATIFAQGKGKNAGKRDPSLGWFLPVKGQVFEAGQKAKGFTVEVFRENRSQGMLTLGKKGTFTVGMDLDNVYTLKISKPGFREKLVQVDTALPEQKMAYPPYALMVNLEPETAELSGDAFYTDFPSAVVRFNEELGGFYHSEDYLAHIQTRLGNFAQVKP